MCEIVPILKDPQGDLTFRVALYDKESNELDHGMGMALTQQQVSWMSIHWYRHLADPLFNCGFEACQIQAAVIFGIEVNDD